MITTLSEPSYFEFSSHGVTYTIKWKYSDITATEAVKAAMGILKAAEFHPQSIIEAMTDYIEQNTDIDEETENELIIRHMNPNNNEN
jgi:hypothetical protein